MLRDEDILTGNEAMVVELEAGSSSAFRKEVPRIVERSGEFVATLPAPVRELVVAGEFKPNSLHRHACSSSGQYCQRASEADASFELPMTRTDIGDFLGLTIETVSRTFTKLKLMHLLELAHSNDVKLIDIDALAELADGNA